MSESGSTEMRETMRIRDKVKRVLTNKPDTKSNEKDLLLEVWEIEGFYLSDRQKQLFKDKCTTPESITRARRDLRQKYPELYSGTEEVEEDRARKSREYAGGAVSWL